MSESGLKKLIEVLNQEREMLLEGKYVMLERSEETKLSLIEELDLTAEDPEVVKEFVELLTHVQALSAAALEGVRRAREGVEARAEARSQLSSYDSDGAPKLIKATIEENIRRA